MFERYQEIYLHTVNSMKNRSVLRTKIGNDLRSIYTRGNCYNTKKTNKARCKGNISNDSWIVIVIVSLIKHNNHNWLAFTSVLKYLHISLYFFCMVELTVSLGLPAKQKGKNCKSLRSYYKEIQKGKNEKESYWNIIQSTFILKSI